MAKSIEPLLKKIGAYLKLDEKSKFIIPVYQRAYSWEIKQCDKLWQDLDDYIASTGDDPYFFGTIIINCQNEDRELDLIDGQQRTITFILLLKALLTMLNQVIKETERDKDSQRLASALGRKRDRIMKILYKVKDEEIFDILEDFDNAEIRDILKSESMNELYKDELKTILINNNFETIEKNVEKIKYRQKDNRYTNYFRNFKFFYEKFLELSVPSLNTFAEYILDKSEIIEIRSWKVEQAITMFNSLNSDGMPLLDADIISAELYSNAGQDKETFKKKWEEFKRLVDTLEEKKIANIDTILMQYMYITRAAKKEYVSDTGKTSVTTPGLRRYYTEINKELLNSPLDLTKQLLKIGEIWEKIVDYPIAQLCLKFNENIKLYLISYLNRFKLEEIDESSVGEIAEPLLKLFSILELVDTGYSSAKFKTFLFKLNIKLVNAEININEIKKDINDHIQNTWSKDELKESILSYTRNPLVFLYEYICSRKSNTRFELLDKNEIEHIMPNSGKIKEFVREDAKIDSKEEFELIVNRLGNKILLEKSINSKVGDAWFRVKIKEYQNSKFLLARKIVEEHKTEEKPLWTKEKINKRTEEIKETFLDFIFS